MGPILNSKTTDWVFWNSLPNSNLDSTQNLLPLLDPTFTAFSLSLPLFNVPVFSLSSINPSPLSRLTLLHLSLPLLLFILHPSALKKCLLLIKSPQTHKITIITIHKITIQNTVGSANQQAVVVFVQTENVAFYKYKFSGYQDTIYYHSGKHFYRGCIIEGTIDFIYGHGNAVFQKCLILVKKPIANQVNIITADGRKTLRTNTGLSIQSCTMGATADISWLKSSMHSTFLGRPWREYSTTAFIHCYLGRIINLEGWLEWDNRGIFGSTPTPESPSIGFFTKIRLFWKIALPCPKIKLIVPSIIIHDRTVYLNYNIWYLDNR